MRRFATLLFAAILLAGCGGSKTQAPRNTSDVPDFVLNPPKQAGFLFGTGIAEQQSAQLAKETADLRARKEIATVLSSKISSMLKDFLGQAGIGSGAEVTELANSVTRSITDVELVGVTIEKREYINGKMYSLAKYPLDDSMRKIVTASVNNAFSSREALLSQFRAKQGFEELDKELEKMKAEEPR
jgi:hypothetical protein